jgi:outer membrane protein
MRKSHGTEANLRKKWKGIFVEKKRHTITTALMVVFLTAAAAQAQRIDLLSAYRLARENDPLLAAAGARRRAQLEQVPQARALLLPQIEASANANRIWEDRRLNATPEENGAFIEALEGSAAYNTANVGINVRQALFRYGAFIALRQARLVEDRADVDFELARQQLGLAVAEAYFAVIEEQDAVRTYEAELRAVDFERARAQRRFELGVGTVIEVNDARARHAATSANLLQARSRLRLAHERLRRRINAPVGDVAGLAADFQAEAPQPNAPEAWAGQAEKQSLEVRTAELTLAVARAAVDVARSERYPRLDLVANMQRDYQGESPMFGGIGMEADSAAVGIQLSLPLFTGGGISAGVRQSVAEREAAANQLRDARRSAALSAESAFIAVESSLEQIAALAEALTAVEVAEESTQRALELGQRTNLDLLNIQRERYQVERNLAAARYQYLLTYLQLHAAVGEPLDEAIETVNGMLEGDER